MRKGSFERFYYEKVGLGEGCGCAEHVTRIRDLDALGNRLVSGPVRPGILSAAVGWFQSATRRMVARRRTQQ
jgi:hypothetical protein